MSSLYPVPPRATLSALPEGVNGIRSTLAIMVKIARQWRRDPGIITLARSIVQPLPGKDFRGEVERLFCWVKQNIRYVQDVRDVETLATPKATLDMRAGDCDEMVTLLATLLEAIGHPTRYVALGFDHGDYSHVIAETRLGSRWFALDPSVAGARVGWTPPDKTRMMVAHI